MASTRIKNLARAIQQANPGMKYTKALRQAAAGHVAPMWPHAKMQSLPSPVWDGETHPDPLTFVIGQDMETGEARYLTLSGEAPHVLVSGATATGKTGFAEIIAAQVAMKRMPWDLNLRGSVVILDILGPGARRWAGRPGVIAAGGPGRGVDEAGNPTSEVVAMASVMEQVEAEHRRRSAVLAQHKNAATWLDLPDAVKREERFAPMLVVLDEYLYLLGPDVEARGDELIENENAARATVVNLVNRQVKKSSQVGIHAVVVPQKIEVGAIGASLMANLPVRVMTGRVAGSQLRAAFGAQDQNIPELPVPSNAQPTKTLPGQARVMAGPLKEVQAIQVPWFGGPGNNETLDKWLPRDPGNHRSEV